MTAFTSDVAKRLREEKEEKERQERAAMAAAEKQSKKNQEKALAQVNVQGLSVPSEVADFFKNNANVGSENIEQSVAPILKVVEGMTNLPEGVEPKLGHFYYAPTTEQFKSLQVSIMTISRSFYAEGISKDGEPKKAVFNQIVAGVILETMQPFMMYVTGLRLQPLWNFASDMSVFTKHRTYPIPMFAMKVNLSTERVKNSVGAYNYIVKFSVDRTDDGHPQVIDDLETLQQIRAGIDKVEDSIDRIIYRKEVDKQTVTPLHSEEGDLESAVAAATGATRDYVPSRDDKISQAAEAAVASVDIGEDIPF